MAAPAAPSTLLVDSTRKEAFLEWCVAEQNIVIHDSIDLFHTFSECYRGVVAKEDIPEGTELLRISRECCIGPATDDASAEEWRRAMGQAGVGNGAAAAAAATAAAAAAAAAAEAPKPKLTSACFTVLRLLHELGEGGKSHFSNYLSILPRDHRIPLEWNAEERALLQGTAAEPLVLSGNLEGQYSVFEELVKEHPGLWAKEVCSSAAFAKAVNWVRSRGFTVHGEPYMIPCADMFNHNPSDQSAMFGQASEDSADVFVMRAVKSIPKGSEVFSSFGQLANAQLVNSYGFVLPQNPFDSVLVPAKLVIDACRAAFANLERSGEEGGEGGKDGGEGGVERAWQKRLDMLRGGGVLVSEEEQFVLTKYDMLPEPLAEAIQSLLFTEDPLVVYGALVAVIAEKLQSYAPAAAFEAESVKADARAVVEALVREETVFLTDLKAQLMRECMMMGDEEGEGESSEEGGSEGGTGGKRGRHGKAKGKGKGKGKRRKH